MTIGLIAVFFLASCGNSIHTDARKLADLECQSRKLHKKIRAGEAASSMTEELNGILEEMAGLVEEYEKKYTLDKEQKQLEEAFERVLENCE